MSSGSLKVKVLGAPWNGPGFVKRKVAEYYVREGRAEFVGDSQIRMVRSHPKNIAAAARAGMADREVNPEPWRNKLLYAIARWPEGFRALEYRAMRFQRTERRVRA